MDQFIHTRQSVEQHAPLGPQVYQLLKQAIVQASYRPGGCTISSVNPLKHTFSPLLRTAEILLLLQTCVNNLKHNDRCLNQILSTLRNWMICFIAALQKLLKKNQGWQVPEIFKIQMYRVRFFSFIHFHVTELIEQHTAIVGAIDAGSITHAVRHIRKHLREILTSLPKISLENTELFDSTNSEAVSFSTVVLTEYK